MLNISKRLRIKTAGGNHFVYDIDAGNMLKVSADVVSLIEEIREGKTLAEIESATGMRNLRLSLYPLFQRGLLFPDNPGELFSNNGDLDFRFYLSYCCTQKCDYCHIYRDTTVPELKMSWEVAKAAVDGLLQIIEQYGIKQLRIAFYGGEPLTNFPVLKKITNYLKLQAARPCKIEFILSTNGTIVTREIASFLAENEIDVHVSLDGVTPEANIHRKLKTGHSSLPKVLQNIELLLAHNVQLQINACMTPANVDNLKALVDFAVQKGIPKIQLTLPDWVEGEAIDADYFAERVVGACKYGLRNDIWVHGPWMRIFGRLFAEHPSPRTYRQHLTGFYISPAGEIFLLLYPHDSLGKAGQLKNVAELETFHKARAKWEKEQNSCEACFVRGGCNAQCKAKVMYHTGLTEGSPRQCVFIRKVIDRLLADNAFWEKKPRPKFRFNNSLNFGDGVNAEWINAPGYLTQAVARHNAENPLVILCSVPGEMPARIEACANLQRQFLEAVEIMKNYSCTIITTSHDRQMEEQCNGGYLILARNGILQHENYVNLGGFWYKRDENKKHMAHTRSAYRVVDAIKRQVKASKGIFFLLRPGSLRIGDAVAELLLALPDFPKIFVLDAESPIDVIRLRALTGWERNPEAYRYISGVDFITLDVEEIRAISSKSSIGLFCVADVYNAIGYASLLGEVMKTIEEIYPSGHRVWIAWPGNEGAAHNVKDLAGLGLKKDIHYTIMLDQLEEGYA